MGKRFSLDKLFLLFAFFILSFLYSLITSFYPNYASQPLKLFANAVKLLPASILAFMHSLILTLIINYNLTSLLLDLSQRINVINAVMNATTTNNKNMGVNS